MRIIFIRHGDPNYEKDCPEFDTCEIKKWLQTQ